MTDQRSSIHDPKTAIRDNRSVMTQPAIIDKLSQIRGRRLKKRVNPMWEFLPTITFHTCLLQLRSQRTRTLHRRHSCACYARHLVMKANTTFVDHPFSVQHRATRQFTITITLSPLVRVWLARIWPGAIYLLLFAHLHMDIYKISKLSLFYVLNYVGRKKEEKEDEQKSLS